MSLSLLFIILALAAGFAAGRGHWIPSAFPVQKIMSLCLFVLVFVMGLQTAWSIGDGGAAILGSIVLRGVVFALLTSAGTVSLIIVLNRVLFRLEKPPASDTIALSAASSEASSAVSPATAPASSGTAPWKEALLVFAVMCAGIGAGFLIPPFSAVMETAGLVLICLLVLFSGFQLGKSPFRWRQAWKNPLFIVLPLTTAVGTLAGASLAALVLGLPLFRSWTVGAGFGWYSLSSVLITRLGDPVTGSTAFLANILRESIAIVTIPLWGRAGQALAAVGVAGATSMDVTLPFLSRYCGEDRIPLAMVHGILLSLVVPILVPFFFALS